MAEDKLNKQNEAELNDEQLDEVSGGGYFVPNNHPR
jgi:bacteriocin-like protein